MGVRTQSFAVQSPHHFTSDEDNYDRILAPTPDLPGSMGNGLIGITWDIFIVENARKRIDRIGFPPLQVEKDSPGRYYKDPADHETEDWDDTPQEDPGPLLPQEARLHPGRGEHHRLLDSGDPPGHAPGEDAETVLPLRPVTRQ